MIDFLGYVEEEDDNGGLGFSLKWVRGRWDSILEFEKEEDINED